MLVITALLAGLQVASVQPPPGDRGVEEKVLVIGKKIQAWRGVLKTKAGTMQCVTKKSTGDRDIDAIGCTAMTTCFSRFEGEFAATLLPAHDKTTRERLNAEVSGRMTACLGETHDRLAGDLADQRAASGSSAE